MNTPANLALLALGSLAAAWLLLRLKQRLDLSRAKHRSLSCITLIFIGSRTGPNG